ncbi:MAG TPA: excinuclease ABC subunit UvrC [Candidatus Eisenbacteria bacterium]|nr:excinuclease ABC subunit UvrC [Candidatus Eisenbacteria bacterium]
MSLREAVDRLPPRPGVYLMKDARGRVLYVGKAKRLDHRGKSYLQPPAVDHPKTARLLRLATELDFIVTESEAEALMLESTLVREHRPTFNIRLKDDKTFPWVKLTVAERVPRLSITRKVVEDGSRYFGPYTDVGALRSTLRVLRRVFPLRTCANFDQYVKADRPCLNYHIRRCVGPCYSRAGVMPEAYARLVEGMSLFLSGKHDDVRGWVTEEMRRAAEVREYERAARWRDQLGLLDRLAQSQRMTGPAGHDADALGVAWQDNDACVAVLQIREGRVMGRDTRFLGGARGSTAGDLLSEFVLQNYLRAESPPRELWLPQKLEDASVIEDALARSGRKIRLHVVARGRGRRLTELAQENATVALEARLARQAGRRGRYTKDVYELQRALGLERPAFRLVCFDISNLGETDSVASAVVFENGQPRRSDYRRMRMKGQGPDDFALMHEAVSRYFARVATGELPRPDLVVIDGGIGQVGAAASALAVLGLSGLPLVGLAKREETIVRPGGGSLSLPRRSLALRLLMHIRDEAHRFAVTYHRKLRRRRTVRSVLDDVQGVGPARRRALLARFGSVDALRAADVDEIVKRGGVPRPVAERVVERLHPVEEAEASGGGTAA